jgi:hypothetical protein
VQLTGHADDINIVGRTKRDISEVYGKLKEREQKKLGLTSMLKRQKQWCKAGDPEEEEH